MSKTDHGPQKHMDLVADDVQDSQLRRGRKEAEGHGRIDGTDGRKGRRRDFFHFSFVKCLDLNTHTFLPKTLLNKWVFRFVFSFVHFETEIAGGY